MQVFILSHYISPNSVLMLGQHRRRWPSIKTTFSYMSIDYADDFVSTTCTSMLGVDLGEVEELSDITIVRNCFNLSPDFI